MSIRKLSKIEDIQLDLMLNSDKDINLTPHQLRRIYECYLFEKHETINDAYIRNQQLNIFYKDRENSNEPDWDYQPDSDDEHYRTYLYYILFGGDLWE